MQLVHVVFAPGILRGKKFHPNVCPVAGVFYWVCLGLDEGLAIYGVARLAFLFQ